MRLSRILVVVVFINLICGVSSAWDSNVRIEIGVTNQTPSVPSDADWGWWSPAKYPAGWVVDDEANFDPTDVRMLVEGGEYTVILAAEFHATLAAVGRYDLAGSDEPVVEQLRLRANIFDLGIGQFFGRNQRNGVMPWIGATYMDLSERLTMTPPPDSDLQATTDHATASLWGLAAGADASVTLWRSVDLTGRLLYRWASGTREATVSPQDPGGAGAGEAEVSDDLDHSMWGLDVGLRWKGSEQWWIEAGWRIRDRTLDNGPVETSGPQVKAAFVF